MVEAAVGARVGSGVVGTGGSAEVAGGGKAVVGLRVTDSVSFVVSDS